MLWYFATRQRCNKISKLHSCNKIAKLHICLKVTAVPKIAGVMRARQTLVESAFICNLSMTYSAYSLTWAILHTQSLRLTSYCILICQVEMVSGSEVFKYLIVLNAVIRVNFSRLSYGVSMHISVGPWHLFTYFTLNLYIGSWLSG